MPLQIRLIFITVLALWLSSDVMTVFMNYDSWWTGCEMKLIFVPRSASMCSSWWITTQLSCPSCFWHFLRLLVSAGCTVREYPHISVLKGHSTTQNPDYTWLTWLCVFLKLQYVSWQAPWQKNPHNNNTIFKYGWLLWCFFVIMDLSTTHAFTFIKWRSMKNILSVPKNKGRLIENK